MFKSIFLTMAIFGNSHSEDISLLRPNVSILTQTGVIDTTDCVIRGPVDYDVAPSNTISLLIDCTEVIFKNGFED